MEKILTQKMSPDPAQFREEMNEIGQAAAKEMRTALARMKERGGGQRPASHSATSTENVLKVTPAMRKDAAYHAKQLGGGLTEEDR